MNLVVFCVLLMTAVQIAVCEVLPDELSDVGLNTTSGRQGRQFPFYSLGRIANTVCTGTNGLTGTCQVQGECLANGGIPSGSCSTLSSQATCCIYVATCGSSGSNNVTYFQNSGYPSTFNGGATCSYTVVPPDNTVCQLRIDFGTFSTAQPTGDGVCSTDKLTVTGGSAQVPTLCGDNNGQHLYVPFSGTNSITVTVATTGSFSFQRVWNLQLSLISCTSAYKAPAGCLQYFLGSTGEVASFNYGSTANSNLNGLMMTGSRQIASLNYGICIRAGAKQCSISYSLPTGDQYAFTLTGDVSAADKAMMATAFVSTTGTGCTTDYLIIPNPKGMTSERLCGMGLPATPVIGQSLPFTLFYVTDGNENMDVANRGFRLAYTQNSCAV